MLFHFVPQEAVIEKLRSLTKLASQYTSMGIKKKYLCFFASCSYSDLKPVHES